MRGIVSEQKLLSENPWKQFTWIEGTTTPIRCFDPGELIALLDYLDAEWSDVPLATTLAKIYFWSQARRLEVTSLVWSQLREVEIERHFELVGKWGVEKWFRVPDALFEELLQLKSTSDFVFAAYPHQLRYRYKRRGETNRLRIVLDEFKPVNLADWFHERIVQWSATLPKGHATTHVFRKTSLHHARSGEDINRQVAADARLSESVLMTNYVKETDEQRRHQSNRTFQRMVASLPSDVAARYGHVPSEISLIEEKIRRAIEARDWELVKKLSTELAARQGH